MTVAASPPPIAWYGGSFVYYDDEPAAEPEPGEPELDAAAALAREQRRATPEQFGPEPGPRERTGVVLGRFLPVHEGHRYLVEFARAHAERLHLFVRIADDDPIPWEVRSGWMAELFAGLPVTAIGGGQDEWVPRILAEVQPDYLFSAELWGPGFAAKLGATFVGVDRLAVPVSGTSVRNGPWDYEQYLPPPVRAWYSRRVCLIGAESTGKTTLAKKLARQFDTVWVPERLRTLGPDFGPADLALAAHGQLAAQEALARRSRLAVFCDTDLLSARLWSERLFGTAPAWLVEAAERPSQDLYLLCAPDVPYYGDSRHNAPAERREFHAAVERELIRLGRPYVVLDGDFDARYPRALEAVRELIAPRRR
ncbi:AAA family ATPase [Dactylosporangium sp. NPDC049140]|uniref:AAA family ATPase n=1 Tax=Dactylosporangium sp. NPDC049140 TaxID=3155647 RepID=UPI003405A89B